MPKNCYLECVVLHVLQVLRVAVFWLCLRQGGWAPPLTNANMSTVCSLLVLSCLEDFPLPGPACCRRPACCGNHRHVVLFGMQVPIIWICLVLEAWALAIQVARLYHTYLNQDR